MNKISIIGAGFYGCYFAWKIKEDHPSCEVTIYEKNADILTEAGTNNQHRVHLGYHYPRSLETIEETIRNNKRFEKEFTRCLQTTEHNFYVLHDSSNIEFSEYIKIYDNYDLNHKIINKKELINYLKNLNNIQGVIDTDEKIINLVKIKKFLREKLEENSVNIVLNKLISLEDLKESQDIVINTTYTNPNLGLKNKKFDIKHELCIIPVVSNFWNKNMAITIMDGDFVSVYPDGLGNLTLSSVKYTPFKKFDNYEEFLKNYQNLNYKELTNEYNLLISDVKRYFYVDNLEDIKLYKTPKVKLRNDYNDNRCSYMIVEDNVVSFLNGKLSSVCEMYDKLKEIL